MTPEEMEREVVRLRDAVAALTVRLDRADANGLSALYFRNLFPTSGSGSNGTANQSARADHTH